MEITVSWPRDASSDEDRPVMCQRDPREQEELLSSEKKMKPEDGHHWAPETGYVGRPWGNANEENDDYDGIADQRGSSPNSP